MTSTVYTTVSNGAVISTFACSQSAIPPAGYVEMPATDPRWLAYEAAQSTAALLAYAQVKQTAILAGGYSASVGASAPVQISTDATSLTWLQRALSTSGQTPSMTFQWTQRDGVTVLTLTSAQVQAAAAAEGAWEQSIRAAYASVATEIAAGAITSTVEIDAFAWPVNS